MRYLALVGSLVLFCACKTTPTPQTPPSGADNGHAFKLVDTRYQKQMENYDLSVKAKDGLLTGLSRYLMGLDCYTGLTVTYEEFTRNARGEEGFVKESSEYTFNYFALGDLNQRSYLKRDLSRHTPKVNAAVRLRCFERKSGRSKGFLEAMAEAMTHGVDVTFTCSFGEERLPKEIGKPSSFVCNTEKSYGFLIPTLKTFMTSYFEKFDLQVDITQLAKEQVFDYSNCPPDVPSEKPFYIHISQGLHQPGDSDFRLSTRLDGQRIPQLANHSSRTGLYSLAIAYCPKHTHDSIDLSFSGYEGDVLKDDVYIPELKLVSLKRGQRALYSLSTHEKKWLSSDTIKANESQVLIDVYEQRGNSQTSVEQQRQGLKKLSPEQVMAQARLHWQGDAYVQVQLYLNEMRTCFNYNKDVLKRTIAEAFAEHRIPYDASVVDALIAAEGAPAGPTTGLGLAAGLRGWWQGLSGTQKALFIGTAAVATTVAIVTPIVAIKNRNDRQTFIDEQVYEPCKSAAGALSNFHWALGQLREQGNQLGIP